MQNHAIFPNNIKRKISPLFSFDLLLCFVLVSAFAFFADYLFSEVTNDPASICPSEIVQAARSSYENKVFGQIAFADSANPFAYEKYITSLQTSSVPQTYENFGHTTSIYQHYGKNSNGKSAFSLSIDAEGSFSPCDLIAFDNYSDKFENGKTAYLGINCYEQFYFQQGHEKCPLLISQSLADALLKNLCIKAEGSLQNYPKEWQGKYDKIMGYSLPGKCTSYGKSIQKSWVIIRVLNDEKNPFYNKLFAGSYYAITSPLSTRDMDGCSLSIEFCPLKEDVVKMVNVCSFFVSGVDGAVFSFCDFSGCKYQSSALQSEFETYVIYQKSYGVSGYTTNSYLKAALFFIMLLLGFVSYAFFERTICFVIRLPYQQIYAAGFFLSFLCFYFFPFWVISLIRPTSFPLYFLLSSNSQIFIILIFFIFLSCFFGCIFFQHNRMMTKKQRVLLGKILRNQEVGFYEISI